MTVAVKRTIFDRDPLPSRVWRLVIGAMRGRVNPVEVLREWRIKRRFLKHLKIIDGRAVYLPGDPAYASYVSAQLGHLRSVRSLYPDVNWKHDLAVPRVREFFEARGRSMASVSVLCVGCRTGAELDAFRRAGAGRVVGIDLYSVDPERVQIMDMHKMTFPDESFDVIFSADSLEHAFDVRTVIDHMLRVSRRPSVFCVLTPVGFETNPRHPTDLKSFEHLYRLIGPPFKRALHEELRASRKGQPYMVAIFEVEKPRSA
jgi:SAM-dependent methyltransferase